MSQPFPLFTIWQASWWKQFSRLPDLRCPMAGSSRDYFDSSQFRGVLPFLEQFVWQGGLIQYRWKGIWRHLVFHGRRTRPGDATKSSLLRFTTDATGGSKDRETISGGRHVGLSSLTPTLSVFGLNTVGRGRCIPFFM